MSNKKLYPVYGIVRMFFSLYYFVVARFGFRKTKRIYVFTDSRGFRVDLWYCKKNPYLSYISMLSKKYSIDYSVCKYKHTTLIDFLYDTKDVDFGKYDKIVLHAGVVDFSPRPLSQAVSVMQKKSSRIEAVFGSDAIKYFSPCVYDMDYDGEKTASLYDLNALKRYIIPALNEISHKLIWIGVNPVLSEWQGNYARVRPRNLNDVICEYQKVINDLFSGDNLNLLDWSSDDIKSLSIDNIHFSAMGMSEIGKKLLVKLGSGADED